jgi:hypothetical protein
MSLKNRILYILFFLPFATFAQPRYSPEVRAERETQWMTDSLHISAEQSSKVHTMSLKYNQDMDKASQLPGKQKDKTQQRLMNKKDAELKGMLNKEQYQKYYKREKLLRANEKRRYNGPHQPL